MWGGGGGGWGGGDGFLIWRGRYLLLVRLKCSFKTIYLTPQGIIIYTFLLMKTRRRTNLRVRMNLFFSRAIILVVVVVKNFTSVVFLEINPINFCCLLTCNLIFPFEAFSVAFSQISTAKLLTPKLTIRKQLYNIEI